MARGEAWTAREMGWRKRMAYVDMVRPTDTATQSQTVRLFSNS